MSGTPKTLAQAILNGITSPVDVTATETEIAKHVRNHVIDFLAQRFGAIALASDPQTAAAIVAMFQSIKKEDEK